MGRTLPARTQPARGRAPLTPQALARQLIDSCQGPGATGTGVLLDVEVGGVRCVVVAQPRNGTADHAELSPRELEIARMVAKGLPNKTIARVLEISTWTVGTYLRRIFAKLNVSSRAAMVAALLQRQNVFAE